MLNKAVKTLTNRITNNPVLDLYKKLVSGSNVKTLNSIKDMNHQMKNNFELLLFPTKIKFKNPRDTIKAVARITAENLITRTHIASINNIPSPTTEFELAGYKKYIANITPPEELSLTFYETETGIIFNWLNDWRNQISYKDPVYGRVFNPNQLISQRNAFIIPISKTGLPAPFIWKIEGMKFKDFEDLELAHDSDEVLSVTALFSVEDFDVLTVDQLLKSLV